MQITLIRHGMTPGNAQHRYIGRTDEPLSEKGRALAAAMGCDPDLQTVWVTSLRRTRETADILFPNARQIVVPDLREMDFGDFENQNADEMSENKNYRAWVEGGCLTPCPGGEGIEEFAQRVCGAFSNIVRHEAEKGEERVVFVVHGGTIMAILGALGEPKKEFYTYGVKNCQGYCCQADLDPIRLTNLTLWEGF